jgi:hypothetical protein
MLEISPERILPSQNFLKPGTIRFIFDCIARGRTDELPPTPLVRADENGDLIAIDGHNLIAVKLALDQQIEVIVATSANDGLSPTSDANIVRNQELEAKFDTILEERRRVKEEGILSFLDLINKYPDLFKEVAK